VAAQSQPAVVAAATVAGLREAAEAEA